MIGVFFDLRDKLERLASGAPDTPFVDPAGYRDYLQRARRRYLARLAAEEK